MTQDTTDFDLIAAKPLCKRLNISPWTLNDWVAKGLFPPPIVIVPGSPRRWQVKVVEGWIAKKRRGRPGKQKPRGIFRQETAEPVHHADGDAAETSAPTLELRRRLAGKEGE